MDYMDVIEAGRERIRTSAHEHLLHDVQEALTAIELATDASVVPEAVAADRILRLCRRLTAELSAQATESALAYSVISPLVTEIINLEQPTNNTERALLFEHVVNAVATARREIG